VKVPFAPFREMVMSPVASLVTMPLIVGALPSAYSVAPTMSS
jgi:hypothetical protein